MLAVAVGGGGSTKKHARTQSTGEPVPAHSEQVGIEEHNDCFNRTHLNILRIQINPPNRHSLSPRTYHRGRWITLRRNYGKQRVKSLLYPLTTLRRIAATAKQAGFWGKIIIFATGANVSEYSMPYPWVKPLATRRALYRSSVPSE